MQRTARHNQIRKYPGTLGDLPLALHTQIFSRARARELWGRLRDAIMKARVIRLLGRAARDRTVRGPGILTQALIRGFRINTVFIVPFNPVRSEYFLA